MLPHVVFLHGVGGPMRQERWLGPLNRELTTLGHETVALGDVIAPDFEGALRSKGDASEVSRVEFAWSKPKEAEYVRARDEYASRRARLDARLRPLLSEQGSLFSHVPSPGSVPEWGPLASMFTLAANYEKSSAVRNRVWRAVLESLPERGRFIIIGHSLGSVVAADLLKRLGPGREVSLLVTLGSPLGAISALRRNCHLAEDFPFDAVASWVNVYDPRDVVTGGKGIA